MWTHVDFAPVFDDTLIVNKDDSDFEYVELWLIYRDLKNDIEYRKYIGHIRNPESVNIKGALFVEKVGRTLKLYIPIHTGDDAECGI